MLLEVRVLLLFSPFLFFFPKPSLTDFCLLSPTHSEASNCGGVAVSGLEMAQNSARLTWAPVEVDAKLKSIMENCYDQCFDTGKEYTAVGGKVPSLVVGANISGFIKVRGRYSLATPHWIW